MGLKLTVSIGLLVLLLGASDAFGFSSGGRSRGSNPVSSGSQTATASTGSIDANVPEPSTLYAVGTALVLLGGAGWYIRRRK